jgi:hypothetical protein
MKKKILIFVVTFFSLVCVSFVKANATPLTSSITSSIPVTTSEKLTLIVPFGYLFTNSYAPVGTTSTDIGTMEYYVSIINQSTFEFYFCSNGEDYIVKVGSDELGGYRYFNYKDFEINNAVFQDLINVDTLLGINIYYDMENETTWCKWSVFTQNIDFSLSFSTADILISQFQLDEIDLGDFNVTTAEYSGYYYSLTNNIEYEIVNFYNLFQKYSSDYISYYSGTITDTSGWITNTLEGVGNILNLEIFPNFKLGYFVLLPLLFGVLGLLLSVWRKD